ncbi:MAG: response regulator transcription factor [Dehalococcoidia bacterium]|nr:response regulator transcription factor [Dehalococcoidia bacterium]
MGKTVLVVEDDANLLDLLRYNLTREGYEVLTASDGQDAIAVARDGQPELIVLDVMLPRLDGLEVCRILRKEMSVPILMLTARTDEIDKVVGLEVGADDYVTKPFSLRELLARVKAMLRRSEIQTPQPSDSIAASQGVIQLGDLAIDLDRHVVTLNDAIVGLSPKEFDLLVFLAKNKRRVFSREYILERVWGYEQDIDTRTVDVHVRWLRQKIEADSSNPVRLLTVRGVGYKLEA